MERLRKVYFVFIFFLLVNASLKYIYVVAEVIICNDVSIVNVIIVNKGIPLNH